jgi:hypothetical protein
MFDWETDTGTGTYKFNVDKNFWPQNYFIPVSTYKMSFKRLNVLSLFLFYFLWL